MTTVLSPENIIKIAKEVLQPALLACEWDGCEARLNSWNALHNHLQLHASEALSQEYGFQCCIQKCSGRIQPTLDDLKAHIELSHMSRVHLPCPVQNCSMLFARHGQLSLHFQENHYVLINKTISSGSHIVKKIHKPCHHNIPQLPSPPSIIVPTYTLLSYPVARAQQSQKLSAQPPSHRVWTHMMVSQEVQKTTESEPFLDFPTSSDMYLNLAVDLVCQQQPSEPYLQLSRPRCASIPMVPEVFARGSVGFAAFVARMDAPGIVLDIWPEEEEEEGEEEGEQEEEEEFETEEPDKEEQTELFANIMAGRARRMSM